MQRQFFQGTTVLELASVLAGPAVGMFFAELGARVIKVEHAGTGGDVTRSWKLPAEPADQAWSAYFCSVNWNKEHHLLDLRLESDRNKVYAWVEEADIVLSNFRADAAQRLGMSYAKLQSLRPDLIYAEIKGFGEGDERSAYDVVLQAEAGFLYMCGEADRPPSKMPVALIDLLAAHQLKEGILVALLHKARTGEGSYVSCSLLDAAIASLANQASNYLMCGQIAERMGTGHPNIAPYGDLFYTADAAELVLAVGSDKQFSGLCKALSRPDLATDARFDHNAARLQHRGLLQSELQASIGKLEVETCMQRFADNGVPVGRVRNMEEVFQLEQARKLILEDSLPDGSIGKRVQSVAFTHIPAKKPTLPPTQSLSLL